MQHTQQTLLEDIRTLSDPQVVQAVQELFDRVFEACPVGDVLRNAHAADELKPLVTLDEEARESALSPADSARLGRQLLELYASDAGLLPFVRAAVDRVRESDELIIGTILAIGLVINLTLLVATTRAEVKKKPDGTIEWKVTKRIPEPEVLEKVINPLVTLTKTGIG